MALNKTARTNLMYIGIVIGILMLLPLFNRLTDVAEEYSSKTASSRRGPGRRKPIKESARSRARRKGKMNRFRSR